MRYGTVAPSSAPVRGNIRTFTDTCEWHPGSGDPRLPSSGCRRSPMHAEPGRSRLRPYRSVSYRFPALPGTLRAARAPLRPERTRPAAYAAPRREILLEQRRRRRTDSGVLHGRCKQACDRFAGIVPGSQTAKPNSGGIAAEEPFHRRRRQDAGNDAFVGSGSSNNSSSAQIIGSSAHWSAATPRRARSSSNRQRRTSSSNATLRGQLATVQARLATLAARIDALEKR